jgi:hypothetical protein
MIVNLSKGRVGEGNARLLGSMLITKLYLAAMSRSDENAVNLAKLPQFYLFVDEFQSFADKSFADILSEARKYKLNLTMAHQYIEQMEEEVRDAVFGNVGSMVVFRVGAYDADVLEKEFAPVFEAEDLVNLGLRQIYLKLMIDSVTSQPFSATTLPPIQQPRSSYVKEIIENSRRVFSKPRMEVEKHIVEWHEEGAPPSSSSKPLPPRPIQQPKPFIPKPAPQPIDMRVTKNIQFSSQAHPVSIPTLPPKVSLQNLNKPQDNQRKPALEHVASLRDALKAVVGNPQSPNRDKVAVDPAVSNPTIVEKKPETKAGPSQEELKKILDVS